MARVNAIQSGKCVGHGSIELFPPRVLHINLEKTSNTKRSYFHTLFDAQKCH